MKKKVLIVLCFLNFYKVYPYDLVVNSVPKCGTYLTVRLLGLLGGLENKIISLYNLKHESQLPALGPNQFYLLNHFYPHAQYINIFSRPRFKGIFVIREPRDGFVSLLHFIPKRPECYGKLSQLSFDELFDIKVREYFTKETAKRLPWRLVPNFLTIRFEDIIGNKGGGSDVVQRQTIMAIAKHLEIELTPELLSHVIDNLFGGSWTFRSGQIGAWKTDLSDEQKAKMRPYAIDVVQACGYEY